MSYTTEVTPWTLDSSFYLWRKRVSIAVAPAEHSRSMHAGGTYVVEYRCLTEDPQRNPDAPIRVEFVTPIYNTLTVGDDDEDNFQHMLSHRLLRLEMPNTFPSYKEGGRGKAQMMRDHSESEYQFRVYQYAVEFASKPPIPTPELLTMLRGSSSTGRGIWMHRKIQYQWLEDELLHKSVPFTRVDLGVQPVQPADAHFEFPIHELVFLINVFGFLSWHDLWRVNRVCREWRDVIRHNLFLPVMVKLLGTAPDGYQKESSLLATAIAGLVPLYKQHASLEELSREVSIAIDAITRGKVFPVRVRMNDSGQALRAKARQALQLPEGEECRILANLAKPAILTDDRLLIDIGITPGCMVHYVAVLRG